MMVRNVLQTPKQFRNFLSKIINKEFLIFLFFLVLSGLFWLTMTLDETYEKEFSIDIRLIGVPKNVVITSEIDSTIHFTVRDKGYMVILYQLGQQLNHPIFFDYNTYSDNKGTGTIPIADVQRQINQQLFKSSKITSVKSDDLVFTFNFGQCKKVPVQMLGNIDPGNSYYLAHTEFTPDSVVVYATKKVLDSIHKAQTEKLNVGNFTEPKEITVNLAKIAKAKFVPAQVKIKLFPDVLTEEKVEVPIEPTNVPENKVLRTFPGKITVSFVVGAQRLRTLPKDLTTKELLPTGFKVVVDYNEVMTRHTEKCRLYLLATPNGVRNARLATNYIDYIIEQR